MHVLLTLALAAPLVQSPVAPTSSEGEPVIIGYERTLHSDVLDEDRRVQIFTPPDYASNTKDYPVLYLLDGPSHFQYTSAMTQFLARNGRAPEMIVVSVRNTDRTRDLTPTGPEEPVPGLESAGGADAFLRFMTDELSPWVEQNYRARPLRLLVGHSFGGLFALYALRTRPDFYRGIIAISPSLQWNDQNLVGEIEEWLDTEPPVQASVYMTVGNEGVGLLGGTHKVSGLFSESAPPTLRWKFEHMPRESHGTVPMRSTYDGLEFIFEGWAIVDPVALYDVGGLAAIRTRYRNARERIGYDADDGNAALSSVVYELIGQRRLDDARRVAKELGQVASVQMWGYLARAYDDGDDRDGAIACYQDCLETYPLHRKSRAKLVEYGIEPPPLPAEAEVPAELLAAYTGTYRIPRTSWQFEITCEEGKLFAAPKGEDPVPLHAASTTEFLVDDGVRLTFSIDEAGRGQLSITRGKTHVCERVE